MLLKYSKMKKLLLTCISICFLGLTLTLAQTGTLRGTVIDDATGETVIGGTVVVAGTTNGTTTDLDGNYTLKLEPGTYTIEYASLSYQSKLVNDVVIKEGEVTIIDLRLSTDTEEIEQVVISAERTRNTENALLTIQRKSTTVLDGLSSQSISKTGDSDAAAALRRVPGVSIEGGKYIYVRGLGDRYTKTIFNGMEIPGLDPDRNTVQMDVFPTALVDNLIVYKSFSPELPGDFTGGVVDISTKAFPDQEVFQVGASLGYNTVTTFNNNFLLYPGGKLDWLGMDDGTRELPFSYDTEITKGMEVVGDPQLTEYTRQFSKTLDATRQNNFLNQSYNVSYGNQYNNKKGNSFGFFTGFTYRNTYQFYEQAEYGEFQHDGDLNYLELDDQFFRTSQGPQGENDVVWSGLLGGAFKTKKSKYTLQLFHTQNGTTSASQRIIDDGFDDYRATSDVLTYTQRGITNTLITGKHNVNKLEIEWKNSFSYSTIDDPDLRVMQFVIRGTDTLLEAGSATALRLFRRLDEKTENAKIDFALPFKQWGGLDSKLKFGVADVIKFRNFETYAAVLNNTNYIVTNGSASGLLAEENIWTPTSDGTYVTGQQDPSNTYQSMMNVFAVYVMNELPLTDRLSVTYGARLEKADIFFTGRRFATGGDSFDNENVLNEFNVLPAANFVFKVIERMNLRLSYSRTVARPSFKEKSLSSIFDPITEITFIGNIDLEQTDIDNLDFRWEYFFASGEMVSTSFFFKNFTNPIEIVPFSDFTPRDLTPRNVGNAKVYGIELEFRKNFKFIHDKLEGLSVGANVSYVRSVTEMTESEIAGRERFEKDGKEVGTTRAMFGQSPFIVNANMSYTAEKIGLTATVAYNVQGKRLVIVSSGRTPDVYEMPFHSLNLKLSESFGKRQQYRISLSANNLINDDILRQYETNYGATPRVFSRLVPGRTFQVGFTYMLK